MTLWGISLFSALATAQAQPMTLDEAIQLAEQNAFSLKLAQLNIERSNAQLRQARGAKGVQLRAETAYTRFDKELKANFGSTSIVTRPIDQTESKLSLALPFDIGGTIGDGITAAVWAVRANQEQLEADQSTLRFNVRQAFFQVLQASETTKVFEEGLAVSKARLENTDARFRRGEVAKVDVLRVETLVRQSESDLIAAQNRLQIAKYFFNNTLSRPIETPVELAPITSNPQPASDEQALAQRALESRKELTVLRHQKESLKAVTRSQRAGLAPSLNLSVQYSKNWETGGFGSSDSSTVGVLALAVPIYDSGITRARVDAARKDEQSLDVRLKQTELLVSLEVRQAITNWTNAQARLAVAESQVKSAQETFRLAQLRFAEGEGINLEVIDAQNQLTAARVARLAALYDSQIAFAELQKAVGADDLAAPAGGTR